MAVRGDDPLRIKQRAGHSAFSTTEMYIREAENLAAGFGDVFPVLPVELVGATERGEERSKLRSNRTVPPPRSPENHSCFRGGATGDRTRRSERDSSPSMGNRAVGHGSEVPIGADGPLNETPLDPVLDRARPAPVEGDVVEAALAKALEGATAAGRWEVVSQLARELEARRLASSGAIDLAGEREKRRRR